MIEIKVTIAAPELAVAINNLAAAMGSKSAIVLPDAAPNKTDKTKKENTKQEKPVEVKPAESTPEDAPTPDPVNGDKPQDEKPEEVTYTLVQVREKLAELSKKGKQAQVKALIEKFGATKLSEIKEENYAELMKEAEAL